MTSRDEASSTIKAPPDFERIQDQVECDKRTTNDEGIHDSPRNLRIEGVAASPLPTLALLPLHAQAPRLGRQLLPQSPRAALLETSAA
jgi:hypothetical protein